MSNVKSKTEPNNPDTTFPTRPIKSLALWNFKNHTREDTFRVDVAAATELTILWVAAISDAVRQLMDMWATIVSATSTSREGHGLADLGASKKAGNGNTGRDRRLH
ncbi:unnamed protein product [Leptosia nina]|uniref:Uncharacterized protein n=1 Tax=Leptosia nina TaxID=320188 RepID=A0AAV1JW22_9NEOP